MRKWNSDFVLRIRGQAFGKGAIVPPEIIALLSSEIKEKYLSTEVEPTETHGLDYDEKGVRVEKPEIEISETIADSEAAPKKKKKKKKKRSNDYDSA
jgi:hypothetical protein